MTLYAVTNPATGEVLREYPTATDADMETAIAKADAAFRTWGVKSTVAERAALTRRVGELHTERREQLADIMHREMGKPLAEALGEVDFSAAIYEFYADNAERFLADESIDLLAGDGSAVIQRRPVGVILGIMPWNFPAYQVARFAGPNLTLGNTIVLKHAPQCPESAEALQQIFDDAGYRRGDRRPSRPGRVIDRLGAGRRGGGRDRRAQSEEGGAGTRRLRSVHPLEHRRPGRDRRRGAGCPHGQHRSGLQRRQADHRRRETLRRLRGAVHRKSPCGS